MDTFRFFPLLVVAFVLGAVAYKLLVLKVVVPEGFTTLLYRQGRFVRALTPGAHRVLRQGHGTQQVDMRQRYLTVPGQDVLSQEQVGLKVSLAVRFAVAEPEPALHRVQNFTEALYLAVQLALREEVGRHPLEELAAGRVDLGQRMRERVAGEVRAFGLSVEAVEVKDVMLPADLRRAFAESLKAKKEAQAMLEKARGESAALRNLANAARLMEEHPSLLELRMLQTLGSASTTPGNTFVLGVGPELTSLGRRRPARGSTPRPPSEGDEPEST
ncbi:slipin family protein [Archangium lansingense]|uniref:Slipin family protein n=1 Tax=Archangium lansingense TaxID=2995310 RepID=A0ABT4AF84_9BACT|nr:slipin family protein [Archangium lansinium]MCY1080355.1 slipin family protein [Archangium lansinium]